jgi:hypothetical protein
MKEKTSFTEKLNAFWQKLKARYNLTSDWHAIFVLFIFAIAGSSILVVKEPIFNFVGYYTISNTILKVLAYIFIILPVYYVSLFLWSNALGQGRIFNPIIKRMLLGYTRIFKRKKQ